MDRLLDLRFVIGLFFLTVGALLVVYTSFSSNDEQYVMINGSCGALFTVFGIMMIWLSRNRKE
ncbi:MAG: hypothetical protein ACXVB0_15230 [Mucilaginibacter sp.]